MVKNIHSLGNVEFNDFSSHSVREATCNDMQRKFPDVCVCVCVEEGIFVPMATRAKPFQCSPLFPL